MILDYGLFDRVSGNDPIGVQSTQPHTGMVRRFLTGLLMISASGRTSRKPE
jgi:hypothetical protein